MAAVPRAAAVPNGSGKDSEMKRYLFGSVGAMGARMVWPRAGSLHCHFRDVRASRQRSENQDKPEFA
jgi:hypothetical protein